MPHDAPRSSPPPADPVPERPPAARFAETARRLGSAARAAGLLVPAFRSPPRIADAARTVQRYPGAVVVSVRLRGRAFAEVAADMVEGVLVANRLEPELRPAVRAVLRAAAGVPEPVTGVEGLASAPARMAERQTQAA